ncbi:MAG: pseudouridine synthase [Saprospiraceae bacterium]|nr:pseudouridine synthase [Saprospiraceae bacterium]
MEDSSISLNKFISQTGICSRREADQWIMAGRVEINGQPTQKGNRVFPGDQVTVDGKPLKEKPKSIYLAFHKPVGVTCTTDRKDKDNIIDFIGYPSRIFPIGRLDKASSGLIFLTNDGDIVNEILREENQHQKEYVVKVNRPISQRFVERMSEGIPILGTKTKRCIVEKQSKFIFRIILTQGLNRQIRRMCEFLNYRVVSLKRIRIMQVQLGKLEVGKWRYLSEQEMRQIKHQIQVPKGKS